MNKFTKDVKRIFDDNTNINSFGWVQYTSTDDFEFKIKQTKINNEEVNEQILSDLISKYSLDFYFKSFGDYCDVKFNRDNSVIVKDYIKY
jgi:hypothetical protein